MQITDCVFLPADLQSSHAALEEIEWGRQEVIQRVVLCNGVLPTRHGG